MIEIRQADPGAENLRPVVEDHLAHSQSAGPDDSNHTMGVDGLRGAGIQFWALFDDERARRGAQLKQLPDGSAEVKSVHIIEAARGRGLARQMMAFLAQTAQAEGVNALVLETGSDLLPAYDSARKLYEKLGYSYCEPIYGYDDDLNSAFMRLDLAPER